MAIPMGFISTLPLFSFPWEAERARLPNPGDFGTGDPQIPSGELERILEPEPLFWELLLLFLAFPIYTDSFFLQVIIYSLFIIQGVLSLGIIHTHTHTRGIQENPAAPSSPFPAEPLDLVGKIPTVFPGFFFSLKQRRSREFEGGIPEVGNSGIPGRNHSASGSCQMSSELSASPERRADSALKSRYPRPPDTMATEEISLREESREHGRLRTHTSGSSASS